MNRLLSVTVLPDTKARSVTYFLTLVSIFIFSNLCHAALNAPVGQHNIEPYSAQGTPNVSSNPDGAKPIAVGNAHNETGALALQVRTDTFNVTMDAYFGFTVPTLFGDELMLLTENGSIQPLSGGLSPWKIGVDQLDETLFGTIPLETLPGDTYTFYLMLKEAGQPDYYLWKSTLTLKPTLLEFAESMVTQFPDAVTAPMSLLFALYKGYTVEQIVTAVKKHRFMADGEVLDGTGTSVPPRFPRFFSGDARSSKGNDVDLSKVTVDGLTASMAGLKEQITDHDGMSNLDGLVLLVETMVLVDDPLASSESDFRRQRARRDALIWTVFQGFANIRADRARLASIEEQRSGSRRFQQFLMDGPPDDPESEYLGNGFANTDIFRKPENEVPVASTASQFVDIGTSTPVILEANDPENDPLTYHIARGPEKGTLSGNGDFRDYTPSPSFTTGTDSFTFYVDDGKGGSNIATVELEIKAINVSGNYSWTSDCGTIGKFSGSLTIGFIEDDGSFTGSFGSGSGGGTMSDGRVSNGRIEFKRTLFGRTQQWSASINGSFIGQFIVTDPTHENCTVDLERR